MTVGCLEYLYFFWGVILFIVPGVLWSYLLFRRMSLAERLVGGFGISIAGIVSLTMLLAAVIKITPLVVFLLTGGYTAIPALWLFITRPEITKIALPNKHLALRLMLLLSVLAFVAFMTYLPHLDNNYALPFHADEWVHWGYTRTFMDEGQLQFASPFTGEGSAINPEIGFHVFLSCFKWLSGASLQVLFLYFPSVITVITALAAYALGEQHPMKFGLGAAFFVGFIPTTVRFLGPSFLVPVTLGLFFVLSTLLMAKRDGWIKYPLVFFMVLFTATMHPPSAVALVIVVLSYSITLSFDHHFRSAGLLALATSLPFLASYFILPQLYFKQGIGVLLGEEYVSKLGTISLELQTMSIIVWGLFFLGSFIALWKGDALIRSLVVATVGFLFVVFAYDEFGFGLPILYDRFFSYTFLFVAILSGLGLAAAGAYTQRVLQELSKRFMAAQTRQKVIGQGISIAVVGLLCIGATVLAIPAQQDEDYYTLISDQEFDRYLWIYQYLGDYQDDIHLFNRAAVEPNKAGPFSAVSGVYTISSSFWPLHGLDLKNAVREYLHGNGSNPEFIEQYGIRVVVGTMNSSLMQRIHEKVYLYYGTPPEANFTTTPHQAVLGKPVTFTSTATTAYGRITEWQWDFGDNTTTNGGITGLYFADNQSIKSEVHMNSSFTISMWLRPTFEYNDGENHEWFRWGNDQEQIICYKHINDRIYFVVKKGSWMATGTVIKFDTNEWHHFACVYRSGQMQIYWNGQLVDFTSNVNNLAGGIGTITIGGIINRWFNGSIREVHIYDRQLAAQEIFNCYKQNVTDEGLTYLLSLDDGGNIAEDKISGYNVSIGDAVWLNQATHIFSKPGTYVVSLTVKNADDLNDTSTQEIIIH